MLQVRTTSDKGRGLFALQSFKAGDSVLIERPISALQHPENATSLLVCANCLIPLGSPRFQLLRRLSKVMNPKLLDAVDALLGKDDAEISLINCPRECGINYCSVKCAELAEKAHSPLCVRGGGCAEALVQFKEHAMLHNDQFLMAGRLLASGMLTEMKNHFRYTSWIDSKLREAEDDPEEFDQYVSEAMEESFNYLINGVDSRMDYCDDFQLENYSQLLSMFEYNNISIEFPCPVKSAIDERLESDPSLKSHLEVIEQSLAEIAKEESELMDCIHEQEDDDDEEIEQEDAEEQLWPGLKGVGMFSTASMINHNCSPNVDFDYFSGNSTLSVVARRDISAGEELFHSYVSEELSAEDRILSLFGYGFICRCDRCVSEYGTSAESLVYEVFPERVRSHSYN
jgi:hypothetical protein